MGFRSTTMNKNIRNSLGTKLVESENYNSMNVKIIRPSQMLYIMRGVP